MCLTLFLALGTFVYKWTWISSRKSILAHKTGCLHIEHRGRLGNLMFEFASGFGTARKLNKYFVFRDGHPHLNKTFNINKWLSLNHQCNVTVMIVEKAWGKYTNVSSVLKPKYSGNQGILMSGYRQSWKYFEGYTEEIRSVFTFSNETLSQAKKITNDITHQAKLFYKTRDVKIVAVHVRLGDIYKKIDMKFFAKAIDFLTTKMSNHRFAVIIVSEGMKQCRKSFAGHVVWFSSCRSPACDMAVLSLADAVVILHFSSFGWWGAWLSGKMVIYNSKAAPGNLHGDLRGLSFDDYYPINWIRL